MQPRVPKGKWLYAGLWLALALHGADKVKVHGALPAGARLESLAAGSPERIAATGNYSVELSPGRYDIFLFSGSPQPARGSAWLTGPEVELNATPQSSGPTSSMEYDLLAEWRVVDESGKGLGPAQVTLEAVPARGAPKKLSAWVPVDEEEKEVEGSLETAPDGRMVFRVSAFRIQPDQIVALTVKAEMGGYQPATLQVRPVLEFSDSGHFFAHYPEEGVQLKLTRQGHRPQAAFCCAASSGMASRKSGITLRIGTSRR